MIDEQKIAILKLAESSLPDCAEKIVILVMAGNLSCGASNKPLAERAREIAKEILKDITA